MHSFPYLDCSSHCSVWDHTWHVGKKSELEKKKKMWYFLGKKLNIARCYNSTLHYCTYLQRYSFLYLPFTLFSQSSTFSFHGVVQHAAHAKSHVL